MKLRKQLAMLGAVGLFAAVGAAQAAILVDDWQVNLEALAGVDAGFTGFGVFGPKAPIPPGEGIDEMLFSALFHSQNTTGPDDGVVNVGDVQTINTLGVVTQALGDNGLINTTTGGQGINVDFELTFATTTDLEILSVGGNGVVTNRHLAANPGVNDGVVTNGDLRIYADLAVNANTSSSTGGGGMQDGIEIARFIVQQTGQSGSFNTSPDALDGQDDALFLLVANPFNVLTDMNGNPLLAGSVLAFTNANTDADPDDNDVLDTTPDNFPAAGGICPAAGSPTNTCGIEDGSFALQALPEPGMLALVGITLVGLGASLRRRRIR